MTANPTNKPDTTTSLDLAQKNIVELPFSESTKKEILKSFHIRQNTFSNEILFYNEPFTPISITGTDCELNCKHCEKYYLEHMIDGSCGRFRAPPKVLPERGEKESFSQVAADSTARFRHTSFQMRSGRSRIGHAC